MDNKYSILLNSRRNINTIDTDSHVKISLNKNNSEINEYGVKSVVDSNDIFDNERKVNSIYKIYGRIEYFSLLNGIDREYSELKDFFIKKESNNKTLLNSFEFFLVTPSNEYVNILNTNKWVRSFKVIAGKNEIHITPAGYSNNVFGEQSYAFQVDIDVNLHELYDNFGFPITELYLYCRYLNTTTPLETLKASTWNTSNGFISKSPVAQFTPSVGSYLITSTGIKIGDLVEYNMTEYTQTILSNQQYYITTPYSNGSIQTRLQWKYNPLIPITLRYLTGSLYKANIETTNYEEYRSIPDYATMIGDNNYVWREIQQEGYYDPLLGSGNNIPFVNGRRYHFNSLFLSIVPDLDDKITNLALKNITSGSEILGMKPLNVENIGKPCQ